MNTNDMHYICSKLSREKKPVTPTVLPHQLIVMLARLYYYIYIGLYIYYITSLNNIS